MPKQPTKKKLIVLNQELTRLAEEIAEAGDFMEFLVKKEALIPYEFMPRSYILCSPEQETYKEKYLTGAYASLRDSYDYHFPYTFWNNLYRLLKKTRPNLISKTQ